MRASRRRRRRQRRHGATWTAAGTEVTACIVTDGDAGGFDETPRERMPVLRQAQQRVAAAEVGVTDVRFLGHPDGRLELTPRRL